MELSKLFDSTTFFERCQSQMENHSLIVTIVFISALVDASVTDLRTGKIHNRLNYLLMFTALLISIADEVMVNASPGAGSFHAGGLRACLAGGSVCFALMFFNYIVAGGGGGDVKLATALGMGFGMITGVNILILTYLLGAIFTGFCNAIDALRFVRFRVQGSDPGKFTRRFSRQSKVRMAPFFLVATVITIADT